jgi:2,3-bisphosphoglycerate-independent phosphoglycerate mutase
MKYIFLVPDGMADYPVPELEGKTPLEVAKVPNMHYFAKNGKVGLVKTVPEKMDPASDVANLSLLGYDPRKYYSGRAPLEAANMGIRLEKNEVAFRCNFITENAGKLVDYSAGHISSNEAKVLIGSLNEKLGNSSLKFFPGVGYRHLAIMKNERGLDGLSAHCAPPHNIVGELIDAHYPKGEGSEIIKQLMVDSRTILTDHEINRIRIDLGENPANMIWLWGQGVTPKLESFQDKWGLSGSIISAVDLIKGIGRLIGLTVIDVPGATGYVDTNYEGKISYALDSLEEKDFVFVHVEAPDEAGHEGKVKLKISALEAFDYHIVGAVRKYCEENRNTKVLISPDHATPLVKRTHTSDPVPFLMFGKNVVKDEIEKFTELSTKFSTWRVNEGHKLMEHFID